MEINVSECGLSTKTLFNALEKANIKGLHNMIQDEDGCLFLVVMPDFANNNLHCPNNIFIDIEEYGLLENTLCGQFVLHHGFAHAHFDFGRSLTLEQVCSDVAQTVLDLQSGELYSFSIVSPIGANTTGFRYVWGDLSPKMSFEADLIQNYYDTHMFKEGMETFPNKEQCTQIVESLVKSYSNVQIRTLKFEDKEPKTEILFQS